MTKQEFDAKLLPHKNKYINHVIDCIKRTSDYPIEIILDRAKNFQIEYTIEYIKNILKFEEVILENGLNFNFPTLKILK